jgi:hypothetical protein
LNITKLRIYLAFGILDKVLLWFHPLETADQSPVLEETQRLVATYFVGDGAKQTTLAPFTRIICAMQ